jgi:hypothetical protein
MNDHRNFFKHNFSHFLGKGVDRIWLFAFVIKDLKLSFVSAMLKNNYLILRNLKHKR